MAKIFNKHVSSIIQRAYWLYPYKYALQFILICGTMSFLYCVFCTIIPSDLKKKNFQMVNIRYSQFYNSFRGKNYHSRLPSSTKECGDVMSKE